MPEQPRVVVNTGPLLALIAAVGDLSPLRELYDEVIVPLEVRREILAPGVRDFGQRELIAATWLVCLEEPAQVSPFLVNSLDRGEAAVIQVALDRGVSLVCIDESAGRHVAVLNGLEVTGSIGVLLRAQRAGQPVRMREALARMRARGIWVSDRVAETALELSICD